MGEYIEINTAKIKNSFNKTKNFLSDKKVINAILILLLLSTIILGSWIRVQNISLLKDSTTGEYIPAALDPFYFLRLAEIIFNQGSLPDIDPLRIIDGGTGFTFEILPYVIIYMHKLANIFGNYSLQYINIISPVVFFVLGLIAFFFLVYYLTDSKINALISSIFLAIIPSYLYRTMAGFSDHEAIGMFVFFTTLLFYAFSLKFLNKDNKKNNLLFTGVLGLILGFLSVLTILAWGGISRFVFLIIPLSFGIFWLLKTQKIEDIKINALKRYLIFYFLWFLTSILFGLLFGLGLNLILAKVFLDNASLINGIILLFIFIDFSFIKFKTLLKSDRKKKYRIFYSAISLVILASILLIIFMNKNIFVLISEILNKVLNPFGMGRVGFTVAENAAPYLDTWRNEVGHIFFWMFLLGNLFMGFEISKGFSKKNYKIGFFLSWIILILGIIFSRISSSSIFNGENFLSRFFYFGSIFVFAIFSIYSYFKSEIKIKPEFILASIWVILFIISARGAIRLIFVLMPVVCFITGYCLVKTIDYLKKNTDGLVRLILFVVLALIIFGSITSIINFTSASLLQAKNTGPSANLQWQKAMDWIRENTYPEEIFVHWWDYGYWVEYLGKRPVLADGGHFQGGFRDHLIGRYLLTTPYPETALSFMKTNDVSFLLIDPTDLGKYGAYSKIGSDKTGNDRYSQIPITQSDSSQTRETNGGETRVYPLGFYVDEDIIYNSNGKDILLPEGKAIIGAVIIEFLGEEKNDVQNAYTLFIYNDQQIYVPLKYIYLDNKLIDLGGGLEAIVRIFPSASLSGSSINIDKIGALAYLSKKTANSLFAQLYLMDDPLHQYPTVLIAHEEDDSLIYNLKLQNPYVEEFLLFQGNFRGPIKIWNVHYPSDILENEAFLRTSGEYAEFDDLQFSF